MSKSHTPGPWFYGWGLEEDWDNFDLNVVSYKRGAVCGVSDRRLNKNFCVCDPQKETMANALLIALAPELLEACEGLLSIAAQETHILPEIQRAQEAVKKARGES